MAVEFTGFRSLNPASSLPNPLVSAEDAAKKSGHVLPNRKSPAPPGAASSIDQSGESPTPTSRFLVEQASEKNPDPTPQQEIRSQLADAARGRNERRAEQLARQNANTPRVDVEESLRRQIEAAEKRREEEQAERVQLSRDAQKERGRIQDRSEEERKQAERASRSREAFDRYQKTQEANRDKARLEEAERARAQSQEASRETQQAEKRDPASGGARSSEKGDPSVNVVA